MILLGKKQKLIIVKKVDFGVYLSEKEGSEEKVLLPKKQVPDGAKPGDSLEVFVYKDSKDRLISTTQDPKLELGGIAVLNGSNQDRRLPGLGTGKGASSSLP